MMVVVVLMMVGLGGNIGSRAGDHEDSVGDSGDDADADDSRNGKGDAVNSDDRSSDCGSSNGSRDSGDGDEDGRKGIIHLVMVMVMVGRTEDSPLPPMTSILSESIEN